MAAVGWAQSTGNANPVISVNPGRMARVGTVDDRFQSYNIEMVEVTGGRFWKPYGSKATTAQQVGGNTANAAIQANTPAGMDPAIYEYRAPINLGNERLRKLAAALGPAYVRVSGTWANTSYFQGANEAATMAAPAGFNAVLTRAEWKGVIDFALATDAKIVTSFAISPGTRDAAGVWKPVQAAALLAYTKQMGGRIAAAEFMNEPTIPSMGGAPTAYSAADFGRDVAVFKAFAAKAAPEMLLLGPGGVGEGVGTPLPERMHPLLTEQLMKAVIAAAGSGAGPVFDAFSYHSYGGVSSRCSAMRPQLGTTADAALSAEWLGRSDKIEQYYAGLRDTYESGKPIWLTETAQTACGGDKWAATFLDSFRYLNQMGDLAKRGVQVHMHNTLAASDYGLLDEKTYEPRPNYWAALLWRKLMGATVLDAGVTDDVGLYVYAQCLRGRAGGVALLVINVGRESARTMEMPMDAERYTLTAATLMDKQVQLNGSDLKLGAGDVLPELNGVRTKAGKVVFAPESITFLGIEKAGNAACGE